MNELLQTVAQSFSTIRFVDILDICIVAFAIYKLLMLTKDTRARSVLMGVGMLVVASWITGTLGMNTSNWMLNQVLYSGAIVMVVLFQPELRATLESIGRNALRPETMYATGESDDWIIDEITEAVMRLAKRRVGALIVIEGRTRLGDVTASGTRMDALISAGLLENVFEPNTPLHDGALVIRAERILAAGCILKVSNADQISKDLGTRHRAALGISEDTDSSTIVVSEETGIVSVARGGKLQRHLDEAGLRNLLGALYTKRRDDIVTRVRRRMRREY